MNTLLVRNLQFIAWENFADPQVYAMWIRALAGLLGCIYPAWLLGRLVTGARRYQSATEELTVGLTVGLGAVVVPLFLMAIVGAYSRVPVIILATMIAAAVAWRCGARALAAPFFAGARAVREHPWFWAAFVVASLPALLPATRVDETGYHLAQVQQWLQHGRLVVDPYSVYPLYTNNWHLVMGAGMLFGGVPVVHMLTWCTGVLTTLWVIVLLERSDVPDPVRGIAALALFVTPLVQRYLTSGLVDIPLMLYLTASVALILQIDREDASTSLRHLLAPAICVGMFTGMKILNFAYAPLFVALALTRLRPGRVANLALLSIAIGSLWYVRNLLLVGDPTPPVLHHALGMSDPYWTPEDVQRLGADIKRGLSWTPRALLALPWRLVTSSEAGALRDWPALGYVLVFPFSLLFLPAIRRRRALGIVGATWYSIAIWIATSYLARYAYFLPLAAVSAAIVVQLVMERFGLDRRRALVTAVGLLFLVGPTLNALRYIKTPFAARIPTDEMRRWRFETDWTPAASLLDALSSVAAPGDTVYSLGVTHLKYYFERRGFPLVGYEFHRGRYPDLARAIAANRTSEFFQELPSRYVVVDTSTAARALGMTGPQVLQALDAAPALHRISDPALGAIYRVDPRAAEDPR